MANHFDGPDLRLDQILSLGRGVTGSVGSAGATFNPRARQLAAAVQGLGLRRLPQRGEIDDLALDAEAFDRGYDKQWFASADEPTPGNEDDAQTLIDARVRLRVGYLYGPALGVAATAAAPSNLFQASGAETALSNSENAFIRALGDGELIKRAVTYWNLWSGTDIDPVIWALTRDGPTTITKLPGGARLIATTTFRVRLTRNNSNTYAP